MIQFVLALFQGFSNLYKQCGIFAKLANFHFDVESANDFQRIACAAFILFDLCILLIVGYIIGYILLKVLEKYKSYNESKQYTNLEEMCTGLKATSKTFHLREDESVGGIDTSDQIFYSSLPSYRRQPIETTKYIKENREKSEAFTIQSGRYTLQNPTNSRKGPILWNRLANRIRSLSESQNDYQKHD